MRIAAQLYPRFEDAADAAARLEAAGIPRGDIAIVGNDPRADRQDVERVADDVLDHHGAAHGATLGGFFGGTAGVLAGAGIVALPGLAPVIAVGWMVAGLLGAGAGAALGGLIGQLTDHGLSHAEAEAFAEALRGGDALVVVRGAAAEVARARVLLGG
ncbi:MAG: hypothetical protein K2X11_09800 [Acetobacteraceae bacterium]|nr:hypothetical protein [Acetobacteraceae bacterium]